MLMGLPSVNRKCPMIVRLARGDATHPVVTLSSPRKIKQPTHVTPTILLLLSAFALVRLTYLVGVRLFYVCTPQAASTSVLMAAKLHNAQAADNFRNLFETPVLFYALVATAIACQDVTLWLVAGAWTPVALRGLHTVIHCTTNLVMQRFAVFAAGFLLLIGLWAAFAIGLIGQGAV
jgi:hypothetical protein